MTIPVEAVEAGAIALDKFWGGRYAPNEFEELSDEVRAILEAASPHMLARAWETAYGQGVEDERTSAYSGTNYGPNRNNPYATAK